MTLQEKRAKRAKAIADARKLLDEAKKDKRSSLNAEEETRYQAFIKEANDLKAEIEQEERAAQHEQRDRELAEMERELDESRGRRTDPEDPRQDPERRDRGREREGNEPRELRWRTRGGAERVIQLEGRTATPEYNRDFRHWIRTGERRALAADADSSGGYLLAPMQMAAGIIQAMDDLVFIRGVATVMPLTMAQSLGAVSLDNDPEEPEEVGEEETGDEDTTMSFGRRELNPTAVSRKVKITRKLLRLHPQIENLVRDRLAYRHGILQERRLMTGSGAGQPLGLFVASNDGIPTSRDISTGNSTTAVGADGLISAKFALKAQYRPRCRWLFHRDVVAQLTKLKDGQGQYLWREGLTAGEPDRLLNMPIMESEYAPNTMTTGQYVGMLADFSHYWIAEALQMEVQRLDELYSEENKVGFISRLEYDAMPVLAEAFVRVKLA